MRYIDTHAHIYLDAFEGDVDTVLQRARSAGVDHIFLPNIDGASIGPMLELEKDYPGQCFPLIGLHPCSVGDGFEKELHLMEEWLGKRSFAGIGETGTDLYWDKTYREQQVESLVVQIEWAKQYDLPLILHSRDSLDLTIETIEANHAEGLRGIFHCFTGNLDQARRIMELGFCLGIGGVITFKNSKLDAVISQIPVSGIVLETDSPYLAPDPYRGKRNEPAYIPVIAGKLTEVYHRSKEEIAKITSENAKKIFREAD